MTMLDDSEDNSSPHVSPVSPRTQDGHLKRTPSVYRKIPTPVELAEPNRFILYISLACPWAARCLAALYLKKLEDRVRVSIVHPVWYVGSDIVLRLCRSAGLPLYEKNTTIT